MFKKHVYRIIEVFSWKIFTKYSIIRLILMDVKRNGLVYVWIKYWSTLYI